MHRCGRSLATLLLFFLALARPAEAVMMVQDTDIVGGEYLFEINYANTFSQYPAALLSSTNFSAQQFCCAATRYVLAQAGQSFAEFVLQFDFSGTSFQPNAVEITDRVTLFTNTAVERTEAEVQLSNDGVGYATQRIVQTPNDGTLVIDSWDTYQVALSTSESSFYYRLTMQPMLIDPDGVFTHPQNQWARTDGPGVGTTSFSARFFVAAVPEPGSAALLATALLAIGLRRRSLTPRW